jgi:hypothetical protein
MGTINLLWCGLVRARKKNINEIIVCSWPYIDDATCYYFISSTFLFARCLLTVANFFPILVLMFLTFPSASISFLPFSSLEGARLGHGRCLSLDRAPKHENGALEMVPAPL